MTKAYAHVVQDPVLGERPFWVVPRDERFFVYADGNNMLFPAPTGKSWDYLHIPAWHTAILVGNAPTRFREYAGDLTNPYLDLVEHQIIPFVERTYGIKATSHTHAGASLGGTLTIEAMLTRGGYWQQGVALSPTIRAVRRSLMSVVKDAPTTAGTLYMDVGTGHGEAPCTYATRMARMLERKGLDVLFSIEEGAPHDEHAWRSRLRRALDALRSAPRHVDGRAASHSTVK